MEKTLTYTLVAFAAVIAACGGSDGENINSAGAGQRGYARRVRRLRHVAAHNL